MNPLSVSLLYLTTIDIPPVPRPSFSVPCLFQPPPASYSSVTPSFSAVFFHCRGLLVQRTDKQSKSTSWDTLIQSVWVKFFMSHQRILLLLIISLIFLSEYLPSFIHLKGAHWGHVTLLISTINQMSGTITSPIRQMHLGCVQLPADKDTLIRS